jgi:hypothetical protein
LDQFEVLVTLFEEKLMEQEDPVDPGILHLVESESQGKTARVH